jgi:hypothetical protein
MLGLGSLDLGPLDNSPIAIASLSIENQIPRWCRDGFFFLFSSEFDKSYILSQPTL